MKILDCVASNFGSYRRLNFSYSDKGVTLIEGPTGAGKSTLCDLVPWVLFGQTAKGGAADDVLSWHGGTTSVFLSLIVNGCNIYVTRTRGPNDLYFFKVGEQDTRGKDLKDTQKLLNELLGMDFDSFVTSHYFHEFSKTASFFTATAKARREITEQLVDMSLANKIQETHAYYRKGLVVELHELREATAKLQSELKWNQEHIKTVKIDALEHEQTVLHRIEMLKEKSATFADDLQAEAAESLSKHLSHLAILEKNVNDLRNSLPPTSDTKLNALKHALEALGATRCSECGAKTDSDRRLVLTRDIHKEENKLKEVDRQKTALLTAERLLQNHKKADAQSRLDSILLRSNTYQDQINQLVYNLNPFLDKIKNTSSKIKLLRADIQTHQGTISDLVTEISDIEKIEETAQTFRSMLIDSTLVNLENRTNGLLEKFFDAEIRIGFSASDADKIDSTVHKDGNECRYTQLSKGQRQMLKLCFGVSVMRQCASSKGINTDSVFFDEALDGCSDEVKLKAISLFESLQTEYSSIFLVEHSEAVKAMAFNKISIELTNEGSILSEN